MRKHMDEFIGACMVVICLALSLIGGALINQGLFESSESAIEKQRQEKIDKQMDDLLKGLKEYSEKERENE